VSKILITGATGFTGTALSHRLAEQGESLVAFVRPTSRTGTLTRLGVECRTVDIKNPQDVADNFGEIDRVYHLAAAWRSEHADEDEFRLVNVEATRNLLDAAKAAGVRRFVHCSTVGVQGQIDEPPADEDYRFNPGDHYQQTKLQGETLAREYFSSGLRGTIIRPVGLHGPGDRRFLKLFRPISRGYFVMIGPGKNQYHLTYIDDLIDGMVLAGRVPAAEGEVFTLAGETPSTVREIVNIIAQVLGKARPRLWVPFYPVFYGSMVCERVCKAIGVEPPIYPRRVEFFYKDRAFSIAKAKRLLGYQPKVSLHEGLRKTGDWYRKYHMI
jgi:nucleoside-diphosphate-sugar epimerase